MTAVTDNLVQLHTRIAMLEALAHHQQWCELCRRDGIEKCELGWKLWLAAGMPKEWRQ